MFRRLLTYSLAIMIMHFLFTGCSTEKNTLVTRSYHNLTSRYNIFFNGNESFKKGLRRAQESYQDDYTRILPIYTYEDESIAQSIASDMDRAAKKASKVITLHSITVKPEYKNGPQTPKQKAFFERNEYNKWVDDNYLMMGKAYMYRHDILLAIETFKFILSEYPYEDIIYETQIWLARAYNETAEYRESERILENLKSAEDMPEKLFADLYSTIADLKMKKEDYKGAIEPLAIAARHIKKKKLRIRYNFILGQLNQKIGNLEDASAYYQKVIKMNPSYEMSFNARINRASVFVSGSDNSRDILKELNKMLKEDKNKEYKDQIYYAMGDIYFRKNDIHQAIDYYKLSSEKSTVNTRQKTKSCLTLANIYYERQEYALASAYYDSASIYLTPDYPDYEMIMIKSKSLSGLVENLSIVHFEDSVQRLAAMDEPTRLAVIDSIIARVRREEQLAQQREMNQLQDDQFNRMMLSQNSGSGTQASSSGGKWYFYNETAKSFGQPEFRMKWGNRKLEDNWRRKNKSVITFEEEQAETSDSTDQNQAKKEVLSNKTREFYLQDIPMTDSMIELSDARLEEALYNAGTIYKNDLKDFDKAVQTYRNLVERYPGQQYTLPAYFNLYTLYASLNNSERSNYYRDAIIREFPESQTAKLLVNPDYINELIEQENEVTRFYEATYLKYQEGNYYQVMRDVDTAFARYDEKELMPKFAFLKVLSIGRTQDIMIFSEALDSLAKTYPLDEVGKEAQNILAFMKQANPVVKIETEKREAEEIYRMDSTGAFLFGLVVENTIDINQLKFEIINFNLDSYPRKTFDVTNNDMSNKKVLVLVKTFADMKQAWTYFDQIASSESVFNLLEGRDFARFIISPANAETLIKDKNAGKFLLFFDKHYKKQQVSGL